MSAVRVHELRDAVARAGGGDAAALPFPAPLDEIVHAAVVRTLERFGGNKSEAARRLGISRPRLLRLLGEEETVPDALGEAPR